MFPTVSGFKSLQYFLFKNKSLKVYLIKSKLLNQMQSYMQ